MPKFQWRTVAPVFEESRFACKACDAWAACANMLARLVEHADLAEQNPPSTVSSEILVQPFWCETLCPQVWWHRSGAGERDPPQKIASIQLSCVELLRAPGPEETKQQAQARPLRCAPSSGVVASAAFDDPEAGGWKEEEPDCFDESLADLGLGQHPFDEPAEEDEDAHSRCFPDEGPPENRSGKSSESSSQRRSRS